MRHLTFAESKLLMNTHSRRQFRALKVTSPSGKRNRDIYVFMHGHLGRVNDDLYWFAAMQIFTKAIKREWAGPPTGNLTFSAFQMSIAPPLGLHSESNSLPWGPHTLQN